MDYQCENGFAEVEERVLECFLDLKDKAIPLQDDAMVDRVTELKMAAISAVRPSWDDKKVAEVLHKGFLIEHPDYAAQSQVPTSMLQEVVSASEAKQMAEKAAARSQLLQEKERVARTVKARSKKYFKVAAPTKWKASQKNRLTWLPPHEASACNVGAWVRKQIPDNVRLYTETTYGRFRVVGPEYTVKSVSWTKRGLKAAALLALFIAWTTYVDATGDKPPVDMDSLQTDVDNALEAIAAS